MKKKHNKMMKSVRLLHVLFLWATFLLMSVQALWAQEPSLAAIGEQSLNDTTVKWLNPPAEFAGEAQPIVRLTPEEKAWLAEHPEIRLGFSADFEPSLIVAEDGSLSGILKDVLDLLNQRLGTDIDIVIHNLADGFKKATVKEIDGFLAIKKGGGAHRKLLETHTVITAYPAIYAREGAPVKLKSLDGLEGRTVAALNGAWYAEKLLEPYQDRTTIVKTETTLQGLKLLYEGKVNYMVGTSQDLYQINANQFAGLEPVLAVTEQTFHAVMGVRDDWPELVAIINKGLESISKDEFYAIYAKWGSLPQPSPLNFELTAEAVKSEKTGLQLTVEEQAWLKEHPVIRVGADPSWAPLEFRDESGAIQGISVDYLERIRERLGIEFEFADDETWADMLEMARNGELDLLSSVKRTPSREQYLSFTDTYIKLPVVVFSGPELAFVHDLDELSGRRAAVVKGNATEELLTTDHPDIILVPSKNIIEALHLLARNEVDVFVGNLLTSSYYLGQLGYSQIKVAGNTPYLYDQSMGVRKDWPVFAGILQKALDSVTPQERNIIRQQWVAVKYEHGLDYSLLWKTLGVIVLVFGSVWIVTLKKQINQRKRVEKEIREKETRYQSFIANSSEHIWCVEFSVPIPLDLPEMEQVEHILEHGYYTEANQAFAQVYGATSEEVVGWPLEKTLPGSLPSTVEFLLEVIRSGYRMIDAETVEVTKDGSKIILLNNFVGTIKDGQVERVWGTARDITDQLKTEEKLRYQAALLENVSDAVVSVDTDFKIVSWNKAAERIYGWTAEEAIGKFVDTFTSIEYPENSREHILVELNREGFWQGEVTQKKKDGKLIYIQTTVSYIKDNEGNVLGSVGINRDITDLREAEQEVLEQRDILSHLERKETLGQLTGSIAHELNQPLTGILSDAHAGEMLLDQEGMDKAQIKEIFSDIIADTKRASLIIRNLRELYSKKKIEFISLNINTLIADTLRILNSELVSHGVTISTDLFAKLPDINADRIHIQQVLINLIKNSLQALQHSEKTERWVSISTSIFNDDQVEVCLEDNGPGIDPNQIKNIFELMITTKEDGMGMGLAICNSIVQAHGGRIWAENTPKDGASIHFTLPARS